MAAKKSDVKALLGELKRIGSKKNVDGMARYGIKASKVFGVSVGELRKLAKTVGKDHELALSLWETGWYEARLLAVLIDDPAKVTPAQMDNWTREFENWADCDTACFHLFDKTPHAFAKVAKWAKSKREFEKRAAFALIASVALHDKQAPDEPFLKALPLCVKAASDERNFVKKGVSWAMRGVGTRNAKLHAETIKLAQELAKSDVASERWVGKDVLRDLQRPLVAKRLKAKAARA